MPKRSAIYENVLAGWFTAVICPAQLLTPSLSAFDSSATVMVTDVGIGNEIKEFKNV